MKPFSLLALFTAVGLASTFAMADESTPLKGCAAKQHDIEAQLDQARAHGNTHQQKGLETALAQVKDHCTEASLRAEREQKITKAQHEIKEREADLQTATQKGDPDKIAKRKAKLAEAQHELQAAQAELDK
jgi:valyl-tRNA synthetase